ncbi:D-ribose-binding periplasmic protein precursor [Gemmata sp. SH-PL17]|uniref:ABC transporter substrate-binding protein n=1 Tax=Gemmata sp. SH-PL17 TaxID=1630693 RepID=UPI00078EE6A1|nr:substrate-binding domain-containing protein [Gemmata sp. SH-PL17]AMV24825.1 D-ribose-binding periplasmic protein precursor [Gemmata sp. SH-PL17]
MPRLLYYLFAAALPVLFGCQKPEEQFTVVVIPKGLTHEHWQSVRRGAERCADDLRAEDGTTVRIIFDGPLRERDAIEQIRIVDRRVATGASGIVLAPQHSRTMTACVKRAADAGVPVVIIDSGLDDPDHFVKYVATDNYNGGCLAARHLIGELKKQGKDKPKLILFRYAVGSQATEDRERGFEETVKKICPDAVWLSTDKYAGATRDSAMREAGPLVLQYGNQVDGIFAPNESSASGTADVLRSQGLNKKVLLMGFDASKPLLQSIQEGDVIGSILQDPYRMGYLSTWYCVQNLRGRDVSNGRKDMSESTGEYLVTKENLNSAFTLGLYDPETQAKRTTEELRKGPKR